MTDTLILLPGVRSDLELRMKMGKMSKRLKSNQSAENNPSLTNGKHNLSQGTKIFYQVISIYFIERKAKS